MLFVVVFIGLDLSVGLKNIREGALPRCRRAGGQSAVDRGIRDGAACAGRAAPPYQFCRCSRWPGALRALRLSPRNRLRYRTGPAMTVRAEKYARGRRAGNSENKLR